jgi:hypothetical protein
MKGKRYESKEALCPFYNCEDPQRIMCEGIVARSGLHLAFATPLDKRNYASMFCAKDFEVCLINKMLEGKYSNEQAAQYESDGEWGNV